MTNRVTYDLLALLSDIGGVFEVVTVVFGAMAAKYSQVRLEALLANRLFYLNSVASEEILGKGQIDN